MRVGSGHVEIQRRFWIDFFVETLEQQQHQIKTNNIVTALFTGGPLQISFTMPKDKFLKSLQSENGSNVLIIILIIFKRERSSYSLDLSILKNQSRKADHTMSTYFIKELY